MWQCENCGYTDEDGSSFEVEVDEDNPDESVRYCPECGSDEVYQVDEGDDEEEEEAEVEVEQKGNGFEAEKPKEGDDEEWEESDDYEKEEGDW